MQGAGAGSERPLSKARLHGRCKPSRTRRICIIRVCRRHNVNGVLLRCTLRHSTFVHALLQPALGVVQELFSLVVPRCPCALLSKCRRWRGPLDQVSRV